MDMIEPADLFNVLPGLCWEPAKNFHQMSVFLPQILMKGDGFMVEHAISQGARAFDATLHLCPGSPGLGDARQNRTEESRPGCPSSIFIGEVKHPAPEAEGELCNYSIRIMGFVAL